MRTNNIGIIGSYKVRKMDEIVTIEGQGTYIDSQLDDKMSEFEDK